MAEGMPVEQTGREPQGRVESQGGGMIAGLVLIVLGGVFFLQQGGYITMTDNWWALFIYLAAVACFANVWRSYRAAGALRAQASGSLVWGLILTAVASIFFFNLDWDRWWPVILIAVGAGIVGGNLLGNMTRKPDGSSG
jgi:hypothetical protein